MSNYEDGDGNVLIAPGTEAIVIMMYDNCYTRWNEAFKWKYVEMNTGSIPTYNSNDEENTGRFKGKYSDNCAGQHPFGGWDDDGVEGFEKLKQEILANREQNLEDLLKIETQVQELLDKQEQEIQEKKLEERHGGKDSELYKKKLEKLKKKREREEKKDKGKAKKRRTPPTLDIPMNK